MSEQNIPKITIFSDGGAEPNPGKGGYGVILVWNGHRKELFKGYQMTTNNRMELMGAIAGLEAINRRADIEVYTDSKYVVDGIEQGWARKWKSKNWHRTKKDKAINPDLWDRLLNVIDKHREVKFNWVKGHNGHPENERCDQLATMGIQMPELLIDEGYIEPTTETTEENQGQLF